MPFDGSFDGLSYQRLYDGWRETALAGGFKSNFRTIDVVSSLTLATTDTGSDKVAQFFNPPAADQNDPLYNTTAPSFKQAGNVPNNSYFGLLGVKLVMTNSSATPGYTITQLNTLLDGIANGRLIVNIGNQFILDWMASRVLKFYSGYQVSNDAAATPLVARGQFDGWQPTLLPAAKALSPGAQLSGSFVYTLASVPVATRLTLSLHLAGADFGET